jgi:hypothetical protein
MPRNGSTLHTNSHLEEHGTKMLTNKGSQYEILEKIAARSRSKNTKQSQSNNISAQFATIKQR